MAGKPNHSNPKESPELKALWQWNCRGFSRKRALLQQYITMCGVEPIAVALQETSKTGATIAGYKFYGNGKTDSRVATLVKKNLAVIKHDIESEGPDSVFVEIITGRRESNSIFLLNVYSNPRQKFNLEATFKEAIKIAGRCPLVIMGDFNAAHPEWGYKQANSKGRQLLECIQDLGITLHNDPCTPTREGSGGKVDTSPDLTLSRNITKATWATTGQNLGSDHIIISLTLGKGIAVRKYKKPTITEWDKFRAIREAEHMGSITDICEWTTLLKNT